MFQDCSGLLAMSMLEEFWFNFTHNLFKPLLLFFYMGFLIPLFRVKFEFPKALYQSITLYLLVAIGWHGGEELANVAWPPPSKATAALAVAGVGAQATSGSNADAPSPGGGNIFAQAGGFMVIGFITNTLIGLLAYVFLTQFTRLRRIDAATVAGYYGSDSAGTFVTCVGVLGAAKILYAPYMPVMLAVMEVPGCLVALFLVAALRRRGMDRAGNIRGEAGYRGAGVEEGQGVLHSGLAGPGEQERHGYQTEGSETAGSVAVAAPPRTGLRAATGHGNGNEAPPREYGSQDEPATHSDFNLWNVLHEVFFNPGLYLLFGGILIGFLSAMQGHKVTADDDEVFIKLFQGILCLFLLEMGITACSRLRDLSQAGWRFVAFGLLAPNVFATIGIFVAHLYSHALGQPFALGTYALFAVLCGAASYIAVPAVQRMAIPEASPTLPLAASLGLTFSYNVTIGIPLYLLISKAITEAWPVVVATA